MKRSVKAVLTAAFALLAVIAAPLALAADITDVGYVDQASIGSLRPFLDANRQFEAFRADLQRQYAGRIRAVRSSADQQRLAAEFQQKLATKQRALLGPLFARAQTAIASVSSSKNLSVIVDKRIVVFGGQDITKAVIDLMQSPGEVVPPVSTPPPSEVGFVDQNALDATPKLKAANDDFTKFNADQQAQLQQKLRAAKTDAQREQLYKDYQKTVSDKQSQLLKPLVDQTKSIIADVARKKNLILVIDRGDLIYGGTDITSDVQNGLK